MRRTASIVVLFFMIVGVARAQKPLRPVDFKNFSYPWADSQGWPDHLQWLPLAQSRQAPLRDGRYALPENKGEPFAGLTFESVQYGDLTGDGRDEAVVVLRYDTGGTQYSHYVFIYSPGPDAPTLLGRFHTGDRAHSGLYRTYIQKRLLIIELFDPDKAQGDCCSSGFIRTSFKWNGKGFAQAGKKQKGRVRAESRLPVDTFGRHR